MGARDEPPVREVDLLGLVCDREMMLPPPEGAEDTIIAPTVAATQQPDEGPGGVQLARGALVGRYVVLSRVGAGGMGIVYAAYDPELDRKVAVKLVLPDILGSTGRTRLLREAQALAKLSSPHVVAVHDVGTLGEQVWLAMEFVEGWTLKSWLEDQRSQRGPSWRRTVEIMRGAGQGLAAAHAASLLHRDFKPENVMVGRDGRVRVMDFGLACARATPPQSALANVTAVPSESTTIPAVRALQLRLTQTGVVEGTPSYMSPEQFRGDAATPTADQFAFCVTLWEALFGERPFAGDTLIELATNVLTGQLRPPPKGAKIPGWLRRVCERGLSTEPERRWPSMEALLDALARDPTARLRYTAAGLAVAGLIAGASYGLALSQTPPSLRCQGAAAELSGMWNDARRRALTEAIMASGSPASADTVPRVTRLLDEYAAVWTRLHTRTCESYQRGELSPLLLDRTMACLRRRSSEFGALVDVLVEAEDDSVNQAVHAAASLPRLARCSDADGLLSAVPPPEAPDAAREVEAIRDELGRALALENAGRYDDGLELVGTLAPRVAAVAHPPLQAELFLRRGSLQLWSEDFSAADRTLKQALVEGSAAKADEVATEALVRWLYVVGYALGRVEEANAWYPLATAWVHRLNDGREIRALLAMSMGAVRSVEGKIRESAALNREALAVWTSLHGKQHFQVALSLYNITIDLATRGRCADALNLLKEARERLEHAFGPSHPHVAVTSCARGMYLACVGEREGARSLLRKCSEDLLYIGPSIQAMSLEALAQLDLDDAAVDDAEAGLNRVLALFPEPASSPTQIAAIIGLARVALARGDLPRAAELFARSVAGCTSLGLSGIYRADAETGAAEVLLARGDVRQARERLETILAGATTIDEEQPWMLARTRFALARALAADPDASTRARAANLARTAMDDLAVNGDLRDGERARIAAWLAGLEKPAEE